MKKLFWSAGVAALSSAALLALSAGAANAAVWTSQLEFNTDPDNTPVDYGQVKITDGLDGGKEVQVVVTLNSGYSMLLDTGTANNHLPFAFNLQDDGQTTLMANTTVTSQGNEHPLQYAGYGSYSQPPFNEGTFNDGITCTACNGSHGVTPPLTFYLYNPNGLTFAGVGATPGPGGAYVPGQNGAGNQFMSITGGWWFAADIYQTAAGCGDKCTYDVAATSAFLQGVPEPSSWALMLLGFGGLGAVLRRRRAAIAVA